jgi:hypothetical protein
VGMTAEGGRPCSTLPCNSVPREGCSQAIGRSVAGRPRAPTGGGASPPSLPVPALGPRPTPGGRARNLRENDHRSEEDAGVAQRQERQLWGKPALGEKGTGGRGKWVDGDGPPWQRRWWRGMGRHVLRVRVKEEGASAGSSGPCCAIHKRAGPRPHQVHALVLGLLQQCVDPWREQRMRAAQGARRRRGLPPSIARQGRGLAPPSGLSRSQLCACSPRPRFPTHIPGPCPSCAGTAGGAACRRPCQGRLGARGGAAHEWGPRREHNMPGPPRTRA